ncbi:hypothetical protein SI65_09410 [Aspergillus cristatus]|uniref:RNase H type-1 domain-containing protein n=1 Tax=Aspergillus cristatus TaxID=573508 RepID=A0A1E3B2X7_ASPCR|nr:hypothetical protein SI65_09410 [Aspergillus cristatus]
MIDLSWANSALLNLGISSEVAEDLPPLVDHEPILTTIKWGTDDNPQDTPPFRWSTLNEKSFQEGGQCWMESACGHLCLPKHEVFDAEATAAYEGLKAAFDSAQAPYTQNIYILLDNQEVAQQLEGSPSSSSQRTILAFQETANAWPNQSPQCQAIPPG